MEHLVLALVLLAGSLAADNPLNLKAVKEVKLDMAPNSFDDQYQGCSREMEEELGELNRTEFNTNGMYKKTWLQADDEWRYREGRVPKPPALRTEHAVALLTYTHKDLYTDFNRAVREGGSSLREYLDNFHFKTLHYLLTQAVKILGSERPRKCYEVYRGSNSHFTAQRDDEVRFGQFASTSFVKKKAEGFGTATFFTVCTYYGVPIEHFSFYPQQQEVLIPPYEIFKVTKITQDGESTHIQLNSTNRIYSKYNCEWVKEKRCKDKPCDFSAGWTIVGDPLLLWGLLLAATALAATGGP